MAKLFVVSLAKPAKVGSVNNVPFHKEAQGYSLIPHQLGFIVSY